jgi:Endonuclease I/Secretion system C-terminal sorting domain
LISIADQNPHNNNQVWLLYTELPRSKLDRQVSSSIVGKWNREHIYPQSRGAYATGLDYDLPPFGINNGLPTDANDIGAGLSDAHHIRAADGQENSSRNNKDFGINDYNGPSGSTINTWKGDVARSLFYMAVRYNTLNLVNGNPPDTTVNQLGDLATLLQWNQLDPSDDFEMNRNNYVYTWQKNRNPFIDMPNLANYIWGANAGQVWNNSLATNEFNANKIAIYPNPSKGFFSVSGIKENTKLEILNLLGKKIFEASIDGTSRIQTNWQSGIYFAKITSENQSIIEKIISK